MAKAPDGDITAGLRMLLAGSTRPYHAFRTDLYTPHELYDRFDPAHPESYLECMDWRTFATYIQVDADHRPMRPQRYVPVGLDEKVARRLHDHFIVAELDDFLEQFRGPSGRGVVALMGGHNEPRSASGLYSAIAHLARNLAGDGFLVATGGGPGLMEAANLGASLARAAPAVLDDALARLSVAPLFNDAKWLATAWEVRSGLGGTLTPNLGVPTWFYGHEPPNIFATHIAKYFENSLREEGLLAIATHGVVFAPGNAGTVQEIFQDGCQNYYATYGYASPMILFDADYWNPTGPHAPANAKPVWPLLQALAADKGIGHLVHLTSDVSQVQRLIQDFRPPA
jgi:predicted Rossmann-fold nucleotide-binding protein